MILLAKSQIRMVHVWQVLENPVCQRAGPRENDFASSIKNDEEPRFSGPVCLQNGLTGLLFFLVFEKILHELAERFWFVAVKTFLIYIHKIVGYVGLLAVYILTPLLETLDFEGDVQVLESFDFYDEDVLFVFFDQEVRIVIGDVPVRVHIVDLEAHSQIVLGIGNDIVTAFEECGKFELQMAVSDDLVENTFPGDDVRLVVRDKGSGVFELNVIPDFRSPAVLNG
jgi:hypothetical protein